MKQFLYNRSFYPDYVLYITYIISDSNRSMVFVLPFTVKSIFDHMYCVKYRVNLINNKRFESFDNCVFIYFIQATIFNYQIIFNSNTGNQLATKM